MLAPGETGAVEEADGAAGHQEEVEELAVLDRGLERGAYGADDEEEPDEESGEEQDLPDAS